MAGAEPADRCGSAFTRPAAIVDLNERDDEASVSAPSSGHAAARHEAEDAERALEALEREALDAATAARQRAELPEGVPAVTPEQLAAHEAGHACACVLLHIPVRVVSVTPDADVVGNVRHGGFVDHELVPEDVESAKLRMQVILCGLIMGDCDEDPVPDWPIPEGVPGSDRANLKAFAEACKFNENDWLALLVRAYRLTIQPRFVYLHQAVTGLLDYVPRIDTEGLTRLIAAIGEP